MALNSTEEDAGGGATGGVRKQPASEGDAGEPEAAPLGFRARIEERPTLRRAWVIGVGVVGVLVLAAGIVAIPYPGPGWLIVFAGLAILATEFVWARRLLHYARGKYDAWTDWLGRQTLIVRLLVLAATGLIVLATLFLLNAMYMVAGWVGLGHWTWLQSPLFR